MIDIIPTPLLPQGRVALSPAHSEAPAPYALPVDVLPTDFDMPETECDYGSCHESPPPMSADDVDDDDRMEQPEGPPPQGGAQPNPPRRSIWDSEDSSGPPPLTAGSSELSWDDAAWEMSGMRLHGSEDSSSVVSQDSE